MDKVTNMDILERTGLPSMDDLLIRKNLRWTGHLISQGCHQTGYQRQSRFSSLNRLLVTESHHQEKPEAEGHKDRHVDITLTAER